MLIIRYGAVFEAFLTAIVVSAFEKKGPSDCDFDQKSSFLVEGKRVVQKD